MHQTQGNPASPAQAALRHPQLPMAGDTADYFTHIGKGYLLICNVFSK